MTPTTPPKSPVDTIREALKKVQTVATTTMHKMDHGCVPDPEGETFHALLSAIRAINPSALSSLSTQPAQTEGLEASVWIATIVYPNGDESHRYAATREAAAQLGHESTRVSGTVVSVLPAFARSLSLPRQKGEVDMETVIDIRAAIIELMGTGVKVPTTEELIAYMATSPK